MFSERTSWRSEPNELAKLLSRMKEQGEPILDLTESNPTRAGFSYLNSNLLTPFLNPQNLKYAPSSKGLLTIRETIAKYYKSKGIGVSAEDIVVTPSTSDGYHYLFRLLLNPGDEILVPSVSYPLFDFLAGLDDATAARYPLVYNKGWQIDFQKFKPTAKTRAILVVNPNNPTGHFISAEERTVLSQKASQYGFAVISDEVFLDYTWQERTKSLSFADDQGALTFTLSGISKILGLPQMKLSWIVVSGPEGLRREALRRLEIISDTYLSTSTPAQVTAAEWLKADSPVTREINERVKTNRQVLEKMLAGNSRCRVLEAEGGWYSVLEIESSFEDEVLAIALLEKEKVYVHPGYLFDFESGRHLVISLLPPQEIFEEALKRLLKGLKEIG